MQDYRWLHYALLAAICAASINLFGKIGMKEIDADLSTAVRSVVQAGFVVAFAAAMGSWSKLSDLTSRPLAVAMVILSGVGTACTFACWPLLRFAVPLTPEE